MVWIERHGIHAIKPFIDAGFSVVLRPHPRTRKLALAILDEIATYYREEPRFVSMKTAMALYCCSIRISCSAIGLAQHLGVLKSGLERPVIFADVPRRR